MVKELLQLFDYSQLFYNDCIDYLETKWDRTLSAHERTLLIEGYRFGRLVEAENEIRILDILPRTKIR